MPTLAILEDSPSAIAQMQRALTHDASLTLLYHTPLGGEMNAWLSDNTVDLLVVDLSLPDMSGLEVIRHCHAIRPHTDMMVCTLFEDDDNVFTSLRLGAGGYLLKADISEHLCSAVHQLLDGGAPMSPSIARKVLRQFQSHQNLAAPAGPRANTEAALGCTDGLAAVQADTLVPDESKEASLLLSSKQLAVLNLVARGFKYVEVAQLLDLSIHTVHSQLKSIYKKLEVSSKAEAIYEARQLQLLR
jgi:DNA-binding NarL/FixJ family response regulator